MLEAQSMQFWMYENTCVCFSTDPLCLLTAFVPKRLEQAEYWNERSWNNKEWFMKWSKDLYSNIYAEPGENGKFAISVQLSSKSPSGERFKYSKFCVQISAVWWKKDDKGISPKVNLNIYNTWALLMLHWCPWCRTLTNRFSLLVQAKWIYLTNKTSHPPAY